MHQTAAYFVRKEQIDRFGNNVPRTHVLEEQNGVLYISDVATFYPDYAAARCAINRTLRYARKNLFSWGTKHEFKVTRLVHRVV